MKYATVKHRGAPCSSVRRVISEPGDVARHHVGMRLFPFWILTPEFCIPLDIIPLRTGVTNDPFLRKIERGETVYDR